MQGPWERYQAPQAPPTGIQTRPADPSAPFQQRRVRNEAIASDNDPATAAARAREAEARARIAQIEADERSRLSQQGPAAQPGQNALDSEYAKRYADWRLGGFSDMNKQMSQLREVQENLRTRNVTGPIVGNIPDRINDWINPDAINTRDNIEDVVQRNLRVILGAQFTEEEGKRLIARAYNPRLDEATNARRVARLVTQMQQAAEANESAAAYFEQNGTLRGWEGRLLSKGGTDDWDLDNDPPGSEGQSAGGQGDGIPEVVGGQLPRNLEEASPEWLMAFADARRANPGLTFPQFIAEHGHSGPPQAQGSTFGHQLGDSILNTGAGLMQGAAALVDIPTQALGSTLGYGAELLGMDSLARSLSNPITIGGAIESAVPTPDDTLGQGVRLTSQLAGGIASLPGRLTNAVTNQIVGRVPRSSAPSAREAEQALRGRTVAAAERQRVELLPADVGGRGIQGMTSAAAQAPMSAGSISGVARRSAGQMGEAAGRAASQAGRILPEDEAGGVVRRGAEVFMRQTRERASRFYDRAGEMADGVRVNADRAVAAIDQHIATKRQAGEMADDIVSELSRVRNSLAQEGGITVTGIREARSILGAMARNDKLRGTDAGRIFGDVLEQASTDMQTALVQAGREGAARMFRRADELWRRRITEIDEVLEPIIGNGRSGEDIVSAVESMARGGRGGVARLQRMLSALPADERGDITATLVDRMGRATASAQDDTGAVFSSETFLTNWNKMSAKGRAALFSDGAVRGNLNDIARIAAAKRDTASLASRSNTPIGLAGNMGALASTALVEPTAPFILGALQYTTGRLLASPRFVNWLARAPRNPQAYQAHLARLGPIAKANPAIANEISQFTRQMGQAANNNVASRAAAESGSAGRNNGEE
jgi:hypothetical protein